MKISFFIISLIILGFIIGEVEYLINPYLLLYSEQLNYLVIHGYYYEILTSIFVTNSFFDAAFNSISMYVIYLLFRSRAGWLEMAVFLVGGVVGNIFSLLYYPPLTLSAGASGGIFAVLSYYIFHDFLKEKEMGIYGLFYLFVIFMISDFIFPNVDMIAHIGGIASGITLGSAVSLKRDSG